MEKKNEYHPHVRLGELYVVMDDVAEYKYYIGKVVRVIDGEVYGVGHENQLYFAPAEEGEVVTHGHTGYKLDLSPYNFNWEEMAKEMLG